MVGSLEADLAKSEGSPPQWVSLLDAGHVVTGCGRVYSPLYTSTVIEVMKSYNFYYVIICEVVIKASTISQIDPSYIVKTSLYQSSTKDVSVSLSVDE